MNYFENYDPVFRRLGGGNPAEKVTETPQSMEEDKTSKVEIVSTSNTVGAKEKPQAGHFEKAPEIKKDISIFNLNYCHNPAPKQRKTK